jgi:DNA-binding SARP family transcriptional activator
VEFALDGVPVTVGTRRERALLALLAVHAGTAVPVDRLVEELWSGGAPPHALSSLRVHVSRLRKILPEGMLLTKGSGYQLLLPSCALDSERFADAVRHGRTLLRTGDGRGASAMFSGALGLWRGPALDGLCDVPSLAAEAARLEETRLLATEEWIEAELALGAHRELTGHIGALVEQHPLRERLWAQLMRALYRSGRQADALRTYQRARGVLVEQLGIEPGAELRRLETAVLSQSPELELGESRPIWSTRDPALRADGARRCHGHGSARRQPAPALPLLAAGRTLRPGGCRPF